MENFGQRSIPIAMYVNDIYDNWQSDGVLAGCKTRFIKFQGCPHECIWCSDKDTQEMDSSTKINSYDLFKKASKGLAKDTWICFTGGEPLDQIASLKWLSEKFHRNGYTSQVIETSGIPIIDLLDLTDLMECEVFFSINPKLNSALGKKFKYEQLLKSVVFWNDNIYVPFRLQFKFVIGSEDDIKTLQRIMNDVKIVHYFFVQVEDSKNYDEVLINKIIDFMEHNPCVRLGIPLADLLNMKIKEKK